MTERDTLLLMNTTRSSVAAYGHRGKARTKQRGYDPVADRVDRRKAGPEWRSSRVKTYTLTPEELERYRNM